MKGIILAGGSGTRLYPVTRTICKQLLPIYDKPMIFYPLSTLMLAGIKEILIISTPEDTSRFEQLLGDGSELGLKLSYKIQPSPDGLAQAFILGEEFIGNDNVCLVLGDNIFYGHGLTELLESARLKVENNPILQLARRSDSEGGKSNLQPESEISFREKGGDLEGAQAVVFGYYVNDPERYGVVEFDSTGKVISVEEKPKVPKSNYAVVGLYFYPNDVVNIAKNIKPSARGELEITSVNNEYLKRDKLTVQLMGRGYAWLDTGTHESLLEASSFIETIERRQGLKVACLEEIAYYKKFIDKEQLTKLANEYKNNYRDYLLKLIK
ncbi:MAG: sugar phosphate nucleotidyltransferase [Melioribacteraceae bacterium]|nr:MAG: sugar phosphate nucleotidyltransferase [Melioribacteraceae bacterium]